MKPYYADELVTLYHADALTECLEWLEADVLVTDPPYGVAYESGNMSNARAPEQRRVHGDETTAVRDAILELWGDRPAIVFGSWRQPRPADVRHRLIWHKSKALPAMRASAWYSADEEIYVLGSGWTGAPRQNVHVSTVRQDGAHGLVAQTGHPTPKPVSLMEELIVKCPPGTIADPCAGTGATLLAAKYNGRHAIGVERVEAYCETTASRLAQGTLFTSS